MGGTRLARFAQTVQLYLHLPLFFRLGAPPLILDDRA
jgi:hypothetical protein